MPSLMLLTAIVADFKTFIQTEKQMEKRRERKKQRDKRTRLKTSIFANDQKCTKNISRVYQQYMYGC